MPARPLPPVCRRRLMPAPASSTCRWAAVPPPQLCAPPPGNWPVPVAYWCSRLAMKVCPPRRVLPISSSPSARPPPSWSARSTPAMKSPVSPTARRGWLAPNYLVAPGVELRSFNQDGATFLYSGTSVAAPVVSGAAALLAQAFPALSGVRRSSISCCALPMTLVQPAPTRFMAAACSTSPVPSSRWAPAVSAGNPWRSLPADHLVRCSEMAGRSPVRWPVW